jgi:DNA mismatch repair protein MutS2
MGVPGSVLERANAFLEREDRVLDRMLRDLATSRTALESEQREAARLREEGEAVRDEYRRKLEKLQERRDQLYHSMRDDLDAQFRNAHAQVAAVIRDLQRGGASAQDAAHARERLRSLEERQREVEEEAGLVPQPGESALERVDWTRARAGDAVRIEGGGSGVLESLPDRRGRVAVRVGAARLVLPAERVGRAEDAGRAAAPAPKPRPTAPLPEGGTERCDLRGQRVDVALDALETALDRAVNTGRDRLVVVHGLGTGALRRAVREHLSASPYVAKVEPASADEGGDGASIALFG